jgi:hypothetical protein
MHDLIDGRDRKETDEETEAHGSWDSIPRGKLFSEREIEQQNIFCAKVAPVGKTVVYQRSLGDPSESATPAHPLCLRPTRGGNSVVLTPDVY